MRPDFKFELLPLHSPLLRQSLLVSFPPLIDMLKFSGYPYLIRGQPFDKLGVLTIRHLAPKRGIYYARSSMLLLILLRYTTMVTSNTKQCLRVVMTLEQAYPLEYQRVQCAFKDSMIH